MPEGSLDLDATRSHTKRAPAPCLRLRLANDVDRLRRRRRGCLLRLRDGLGEEALRVFEKESRERGSGVKSAGYIFARFAKLGEVRSERGSGGGHGPAVSPGSR